MTPRTPHKVALLVLALLLAPPAAAAADEIAKPPAASQPVLKAMSREEADPIYRAELGPLYKPELAETYHAVHHMLERWFAAPEDRKVMLRRIEESGLDANVVGRLARLRIDWPALEAGVYYLNEKVGPHQVYYFLGVPKGYDRAKAWPLVIKLPTGHAFVTEPRPDGARVAQIYADWVKEELARHPDALVLMPLLNMDELWGPGLIGMNTVIQPLQHAAGRVNVDPARIDLMGHAMSGHAVWNIGLHYTTYFAALFPLAGAAPFDWQRLRLANLRNTSVVVWHDATDKSVPVEQARQLTRILTNFKYSVAYDETKNLGHAPSEEVLERGYARMRAAVRDPYPAQVSLRSNRPDTMFNRVDWVQVYQPLHSGAERRLRIARGTGPMLVHDNAHTLNAVRSGPNRFELTGDNVGILRLYFNDQLVDFGKPVTITLNRRVRFEGMLTPGVEEMLKDQLFLGRGWRYFTAVKDIELMEPITRPATRRAGS